MQNQKAFLGKRGRMAFIGVGLWLFLAAWSVSAFWQHIDELGATYRLGSRLGALGGEFALLMFVLLHCFDKHLGVRRWALIFSFVLGSVVLIHTGALRGMNEAAQSQIATEKRLAETLTGMSKEQAAAIRADQTGTQRERLAKSRAAVQQQAEVAKSAQKEVAATITSSADKVKDSSIMPRWYLDGWMYNVIFVTALLFATILFLLMMRDDVDADFDGVIDRLQPPQVVGFSQAITPPVTARKPSENYRNPNQSF